MALGAAGIDITCECTTDLSAKRFYIVILSDDNTVALASTAAETVFGVLQNKPDGTAGESAVVRILGLSKVTMGESSLAVTALLSTTAAGTAEQADGAGDFCVGQLVISADSGEIGTVFVNPGMGTTHASDA